MQTAESAATAPPKPPKPAPTAETNPFSALYATTTGTPQPTVKPAEDLLALLAAPAPYDPLAVPDAREALLTTLSAKAAADKPNPERLAEAFGAYYGADAQQRAQTGGSGNERVQAYQQLAEMQAGRPAGGSDPKPLSVDQARGDVTEAERAQRMHTLGLDKPVNPATGPKPLNIKKKTEPMSVEAYEALPPLQKAAIDFNTMLVGAVKKDTRLQNRYEPTDQERETYDLAVEKTFGEGRGSDMFAPETLSVLRQIGYKDDMADLDDFLGLKAAIRTKDLKQLEPGERPIGPGLLPPTQEDRSNLVGSLARGTASMEAALAESRELVQNITKTAALDRKSLVETSGGKPATGSKAPGFGTDPLDAYFQTGYKGLMNKSLSRDQIVESLQTDVANGVRSQAEIDAFWKYVDTRFANEQRFGITPPATEGVEYRTPEEFRVLLGLDKEARDGGS